MIDNETGEIVLPMIRTRYNYDRDAVSRETGLATPEKTRTQQQFAKEVDINTIVERFGLTGQLPQNLKVPVSGDYTDTVNDYQTALNMVIAAEASFMELPAKVRARFNNDPQKLMEFVANKDNLEEARKLGIATPAPVPEPEPKPLPVRVIPDPPSKA